MLCRQITTYTFVWVKVDLPSDVAIHQCRLEIPEVVRLPGWAWITVCCPEPNSRPPSHLELALLFSLPPLWSSFGSVYHSSRVDRRGGVVG